MQSARYSCQILTKPEFPLQIFENSPNFMKIRPVGAVLFHADGRTDMTKLIVAFRSFANAPDNAMVGLSVLLYRHFIWVPSITILCGLAKDSHTDQRMLGILKCSCALKVLCTLLVILSCLVDLYMVDNAASYD